MNTLTGTGAQGDLPVAHPSKADDIHQPNEKTATEDLVATRVGIQFPEALTYERWQHTGRQIARVVDSSAWCTGDWIIYGESKYADRYRRAIEMAGLDYQTVRNYVWVARRFAFSRRRENLSFQHHAEVASLPPAEQDRWLDRAERESWSRNQLRARLKNSRANKGSDESSRVALPRISANAERVRHWRAAADEADLDLKNWIVAVLDAAAFRELRNEPNAGTRGNPDQPARGPRIPPGRQGAYAGHRPRQ